MIKRAAYTKAVVVDKGLMLLQSVRDRHAAYNNKINNGFSVLVTSKDFHWYSNNINYSGM